MSGAARQLLKRAAEAMLCAGPAALARRTHRDDVIVLAYHNVVPAGSSLRAGDLSLHLPQREFSRQLDLLARTHDIVPLAEALGDRRNGRRRPRAAITFDDAYSGALSAGLEELASRGLPATFFVAPGLLGGHAFWWDALSSAAGLDEDVRERSLEAHDGADERIREIARSEGRALHDPPAFARSASEEELARAASVAGVTLASHTWSHPNLARLTGDRLRIELERPLRWLEARFPNVGRWVSFPYGLAPSTPDVIRSVGYAAAFLVAGGYSASGTDRFAVPRLNIPAGLSSRGFELRISGLLA